MKITTDDWHIRSFDSDMLVFDLFLGNGQHAVLEVCPMKNPSVPNGQVPEMVVFCEFPGEKLAEGSCVARWAARPPDKTCAWSHVEIAPALVQQIREKLGYTAMAAAAA